MNVREDLVETQSAAWDAIGLPGTWWTGAQRIELATTALRAMTEATPLVPWVAPSTVAGWLPADIDAPLAAHDATYRVARHAGTLTEDWFRQMTQVIGEQPYVELVAVACTVAAVTGFRRAAGLDAWALPSAQPGEPSRELPVDLVDAELNWVQVRAPADRTAAVVQAVSSVPAEQARLWGLASVQYIPDLEMVDPRWTRGTLSRPQIELVAARVSQLRECFY